MKPIFYLIFALSLPSALHADDDIPFLLPEERSAVEAQTGQFNEAISPALATGSKSTVRIWSGSRRMAYGTVVGDGSTVLSKWSEVARATGQLRVGTGNEYRPISIAGVYEDEDLVLLKVEGATLVPVKWSLESNSLGSFIAAPQPDGTLAAFGVISVLERNLRDTDMAYLGVIGDPKHRGPGVMIEEVQEKTGAYDAGLKKGDIILKVGDRVISGLLELKNSLTVITPGTTISMTVEINEENRKVDVLLGNRPDIPQYSGDRLSMMERMGGPISRVRDSFSHVIQTDMRLKPNQVGGPVVDLQGRTIGITMARADRTRSFVMPASAVIDLLKTKPVQPERIKRDEEQPQPRVVARGGGGGGQRGRAMPGGEERMRQHLSDMQRLMDHMRSEMEALEEP